MRASGWQQLLLLRREYDPWGICFGFFWHLTFFLYWDLCGQNLKGQTEVSFLLYWLPRVASRRLRFLDSSDGDRRCPRVGDFRAGSTGLPPKGGLPEFIDWVAPEGGLPEFIDWVAP